MRVKSGYISHIRNLDIIATHFVPNILNLLELYDGVKKAFRLDFWAVDEYYIDCKGHSRLLLARAYVLCLVYESGNPISLQLLASHLFYRALLTVPSLIRTWLLDCTDRQLSSSVVSYTSQYFSPVIIRTELAHVKSPETVAELTDENMTIKVAQAVNEVTASYLVDEHQLEITLKLPVDWPLHTIEIKDTKKVGVLEDRWRAWVFGVQQIIWSQVRDATNWFQGTSNSRPSEWADCRWPESLQKKCSSSFRRTGRMRHLLLVRIFHIGSDNSFIDVQNHQCHGWYSASEALQNMQESLPCWVSLQGRYQHLKIWT